MDLTPQQVLAVILIAAIVIVSLASKSKKAILIFAGIGAVAGSLTVYGVYRRGGV